MIASLLLALAAAPAQGGLPPEGLVVGSKNFPESHLLGEILAAFLETRLDVPVRHASGLGGTLLCLQALENGEIDLYPEYSGTAWAVILGEEVTTKEPLQVFLEVESGLRRRLDLEWLPPFGFENTYVLAMRRDRAEALGVESISDLAPHAPELRAGFSLEFLEREDGYPGLAEAYGLELGEVRGIEHGLAYEALEDGSLDVVDAYSTDGKLLRYDVLLLEDDRRYFPPYHAAPLVRGELLRAAPVVREALEELAFRIDGERMLELNHAVDVEGRPFGEVARRFLSEEGLVRGAAPEARATRGEGFPAFFAARWRETLRLTWEHVQLTGLSVLLAALLAVPLGIAVSRRPWGQRLSLGVAGTLQTVPSLALLAFLIAVPGLGLTVRSAVVALTLYAVLPILRNTVTGLRGVDADLVDAARGLGLTERQTLLRVQLPLATGTILAGIRTAAVIDVGFATLAAFIGAGGLGEPIVTGLYLNDTRLILAGALPAAALALLADAALGAVERWVTPRGLRLADPGS